MNRFIFPLDIEKKHSEVIIPWIQTLESGTLDKLTELSIKGDFLKDIFEVVLGYPGAIAGRGKEWNLYPEKITSTGGGYADGVLGYFRKNNKGEIDSIVIAGIELKSAATDLDRQQERGYTPVQQGWRYADETIYCRWIIVSNFKELRLYNKAMTPIFYESFLLKDLANINIFKRFYFLLCRENFLSKDGSALIDRLLEETSRDDEEITNKLYQDYKKIRLELLRNLEKNNPSMNNAELVSYAQKILDRILFISFSESKGLLPPNILKDTYNKKLPGLSKWRAFVYLFKAVNQGDPPIWGYNGGLFAEDPVLNSLIIHDEICRLFLKLNGYDYQSEVSVNVLGYIFEQSITDIEKLKNSDTLLVDPRRKKEGIYYTPDFVTRYIVEEAVGSALQHKFMQVYDKYKPDKHKRAPAKKRRAWRNLLLEYREKLKTFRICDPACGSGAFLVAAFDYLYNEYERINREIAKLEMLEKDKKIRMAEGQISALDLNKEILNSNLFGVDINPESVEITKLSLWIKTAQKNKQLTFLDDNIKCGNSLINDSYIDSNAFNWEDNFPQVFKDGGFDVVIGNPPYIKLQNFKRVHPEQAEWLIKNYESTKTGNFDMYLPFIEKGISILNAQGFMGFIAPSVWLLNNYGKGLRRLCAENRYLYRWIDFKSFQVFNDVTTYTALQFYTKKSASAVQYSIAPDGDIALLNWTPNIYDKFGKEPWILVSDWEEKIISKLHHSTISLESMTDIFVGIQTSADKIYHLERIEPGKYFSKALNKKVTIEEEVMRPLISGEHVRRYSSPITNTYLLFPYDISKKKPRLYTQKEMYHKFKNAWKYLKSFETILRGREKGKMDIDDGWWAYNYPKNLHKQEGPKLMVPRLVLNLKADPDPKGIYFLDNVDVGGIRPKNGIDLFYLLSILNNPVTNFVWKRSSKPFKGGYGSANKQFIKSLPIPNVDTHIQKQVGAIAQQLTKYYTKFNKIEFKVFHRIINDFSISKSIPQKISNWRNASFYEIYQELKKKKKSLSVSERDDWEQYINLNKEKMYKISIDIKKTESELNYIIYGLFGLTDKEISVIEGDVREIELFE